MSEWISVKERLPHQGGPVRVRLVDGTEKDGWFIVRKSIFVSPDGAVGYGPTHWRLENAN